MRDYRAYILGFDGHRFIQVEAFLSDHPDDAAALKAAKLLTDKHDVEVLASGRLVARLSLGEEIMSPGLVPSLVSAAQADDNEKSTVKPPVELTSLKRVSELAGAASTENHLLLGW
jgi:hypothetical protein